jgi:hypothetical protein
MTNISKLPYARHQIKKRTHNNMNSIDYMGFKLTVLITRQVLESTGKEENKNGTEAKALGAGRDATTVAPPSSNGIAEIGALRATKSHRKGYNRLTTHIPKKSTEGNKSRPPYNPLHAGITL